jgi:16S rRNA (guanine(527)-N(7))-methyltransferase RsmG
LSELDRARRRTNLTGPLSAEALVEHALESALGERLIPHGARVIDIGSGAGFPGVPLAIVRSDLVLTALEPRRKRADFLRRVIEVIGLPNASVRQARARDLEERAFDLATLRAVGDLESVIGTASFLKEGGCILFWTTEPVSPLFPGSLFAKRRVVGIPHSRRRVVAVYGREPLPTATEA